MLKRNKRRLFDQPQSVINRWFSIQIIRKTRPCIEGTFRIFLRVRLQIQGRKQSRVLKRTLNTTVREFRKLKKSEFETLKVLFNIALFFLIAERDIQAVKVDALSHSDPWKRNLSLRVMLLVMHEWNMSKVAPANKMNQVYLNAGISNELIDDMSRSLRQVNKAQSKARKLLSHARHSTIAHRDSDAMLQYETIIGLDALETMEIMSSFYEAADLFITTLPKVMNEASSFSSLLKQHGKNA